MSVSRSQRLMANAVRLFCCTMLVSTIYFAAGECQAQLYGGRLIQWNPRAQVVRTPQRVVTQQRVVTPQYRTVKPVTGYGSNFHRNFTIRQQQQRVESGAPLQRRKNVLFYGVR